MTEKNPFDGEWRILSWEQRYDDGRIQLPLGPRLEGFIRYMPDGRMVCMIARADQQSFVEGGQWNAPAYEKAGAYDSMLAYAGRYSVDGDVVTHHVELSLFPNWRGMQQRRRFQLRPDGILELTARLEEGTAQARTAVLAWIRSISEADTQ